MNIKFNRIHVSEEDRQRVTCLNPDGSVVCQYEDPDMKLPRGMCGDHGDNIVVNSEISDSFCVVTATGEKHKILLTGKDGIKSPVSVAYRAINGTMIIRCRDSEKRIIFKLTLK